MRNLLAFDLGASNGRAILGQFDGEKLTMRELHRFENNYIEMNGVFYWDLPYLYNQLKQGLLAFKNANVGELDCIGIDTWGVDYGLLDQNGQLLSNPRSYRYAVDEDMAEVWKTVDFPTLFARTGIATMNFNTVYQLYRRKRQHDPALDAAQTLLMLPDLLGFFLTGEAKTEYTNATTSMLYNPTTKDWIGRRSTHWACPERSSRSSTARVRCAERSARSWPQNSALIRQISPLSARTTRPPPSPPSPARAALRSAPAVHGRCSAWRRTSRFCPMQFATRTSPTRARSRAASGL